MMRMLPVVATKASRPSRIRNLKPIFRPSAKAMNPSDAARARKKAAERKRGVLSSRAAAESSM